MRTFTSDLSGFCVGRNFNSMNSWRSVSRASSALSSWISMIFVSGCIWPFGCVLSGSQRTVHPRRPRTSNIPLNFVSNSSDACGIIVNPPRFGFWFPEFLVRLYCRSPEWQAPFSGLFGWSYSGPRHGFCMPFRSILGPWMIYGSGWCFPCTPHALQGNTHLYYEMHFNMAGVSIYRIIYYVLQNMK